MIDLFYTKTGLKVLCFSFLLSPILVLAQSRDPNPFIFTPSDIDFLKRFSLSVLPELPSSPSNRYADNGAAAKLGKALFFDKRFSKNRKIACASCHQPEKFFTDGLAFSQGLGTTRRSSPSLIGAAWSPWQYWDGRKDSLWAQALSPIEQPDEMALSRSAFVRTLLKYYRKEYRKVFGETASIKTLKSVSKKATPLGNEKAKARWGKLSEAQREGINRVFTNAGKALMAYQRQLRIPPARFDHFIDRLKANDAKSASSFSKNEARGLRLFMGKANCASCHNGPLFTNFEFHNIGAPEFDQDAVDLGRYTGVASLAVDEFTCLSKWSDAKEGQCEEMQFLKKTGPELVGAFKTPTLRNIAVTAPYMQAGQFTDLKQVLAHYNLPKPPLYDRKQHPNRPHFDILPLQLSEQEIEDIVTFLKTLTSVFPKDDIWWRAERRKN